MIDGLNNSSITNNTAICARITEVHVVNRYRSLALKFTARRSLYVDLDDKSGYETFTKMNTTLLLTRQVGIRECRSYETNIMWTWKILRATHKIMVSHQSQEYTHLIALSH